MTGWTWMPGQEAAALILKEHDMKKVTGQTLRCLLLLVLMLCPACGMQARVKLTFTTSGINNATYTVDSNTGAYTVKTTGSDPYIYCAGLSRNLTSTETCLYFQYKTTRQLNRFQVYFGNTFSEARSKVLGNLVKSTEWKEAEFDLASSINSFAWKSAGQKLRLDFGDVSGLTIEIKDLCIRAKGDGTLSPDEQKAANLSKYLSSTFPGTIDDVTLGTLSMKVSGRTPAVGTYRLVELPPYANVTEDAEFVYSQELANGDFEVSLTRKVSLGGFTYDRALSKWAILDVSGEKPTLASHAHYADSIIKRRAARYMPLKGKKGLGGFVINENLSDLDDLGVTSVTVNMVVNTMISTKASFGSNLDYTYGGKRYYIDGGQVSYFDNVFRECYKRGIIVSAILLFVPTPADSGIRTATVHPDYSGGYYSMPNMTTPEGVNAYAAIMTYLADRYSASSYGRIHHWILHNEVDEGQTWTNMGAKSLLTYLDEYQKSLRLVYNIVRQYDPNSSVLASFTHTWTQDSPDGLGFNTHNMLEQSVAYSRLEGDYQWGIAYHPYPQNLLKPRFWIDDTASTYSASSKYCTFKNLEVIDSWIIAPEHLYKGHRKRVLFLSENGTNSPDYSSLQLAYQAAGACWAWKKVKELDGIDAIQWHNWRDNREEFGLCIGLRRYPDDATDPNGKKPVWYVWEAAGTEQEDEVFKPYLSYVSRTSWDKIFDNSLPTPVESVLAGDDASLPCRLYTLDGKLAFEGTELPSASPLRPGIYVMRRGATTRKIQLR